MRAGKCHAASLLAFGLVVLVYVSLGEKHVVQAFDAAHVAGAQAEYGLRAACKRLAHEHRTVRVDAVGIHLLGLREEQVLGREERVARAQGHLARVVQQGELQLPGHPLGHIDCLFACQSGQKLVEFVLLQQHVAPLLHELFEVV